MSDLTVEPYTVDHYRQLFGAEPDGTACLNAATGPGFALIDGGHILALGGVRVQGIGQAWAYLGDDAKAMRKSVLLTARAVIQRAMVDEKLYRVYAEATVDPQLPWFKHLGFVQSDRLFVR